MLNLFEHILNPLLGMSITAAFVAVVVILLRAVLKKRAPKQVVCLLWLVVFARLLIPVMVESPISLVPNALGSIIQVEQSEVQENMEPTAPVESADPAPTNEPVIEITPAVIPGNPVPSQPVSNPTQDPLTELPPVLEPSLVPEVPPVVQEPTVEPSIDISLWMPIVAAAWLVGVAVMLVVGIGSYVKLRRRVYDAIRTTDGVWEHPSLTSPFILGLFRPKIYLPMGIKGSPRQFILHHERAHLRRLDHVVKPICWLALAIHWFNPLAWVAFLLMSRDIETACDESVIRKLGSEVKADYSATLLALATDKRFPAPSPLSFGEGDAKVRIKNVLKFKKPALWVSIIAIVVVVVAAVCLLTDPMKDEEWTVPQWASELSAEDMEYAILRLWQSDGQATGFDLTEPQKKELADAILALPEDAFGEVEGLLSTLTVEEWLKQGDFWSDPYYIPEGGTILISLTLKDGCHAVLMYYQDWLRLTVLAESSGKWETPWTKSLRCSVENKELMDCILQWVDPALLKSDPDLSGYATDPAYPGLYFLEEPSSTVGTKITAYKLIDGELVLVGGYDEHMANNFSGLIGPDGEEQHIFASPDEVYAMFEDLLAAACRELDPNWTPLPAVGERFLSALNDEVEIVDPGLGMTGMLSELVEATAPTVEMKITKMAAVDLDSDGIKELLLLLETPSTVHGTMILRCTGAGSQIYGYELWARAFNDIKTDGTFSFSGGVSDGGFGRISFTSGGYEVERITYRESIYPDSTVAYYVNKQPATREEFLAACHTWQNTPGVTWVEYTPENAELLLRGGFAGGEQETLPYKSRFLADLTHDGVRETITLTYREDWQMYYLTVENTAGETLWQREAGLVHAGWDGFYLYEKDGKQYLMRWLPAGGTGIFNYAYEIFSLTETGEQIPLTSGSFMYDTNSVEGTLSIDVEGLKAFEAEVNALLEDTIVLITTDEGTPYYSTRDVTLCRLWAAPVSEVQEWKQSVVNRLPLVMAYMELEPVLLASVEEQVALHMGDYDLAYVERVEDISERPGSPSTYRVTYKPGDYDGVSRVTWQDSRYFNIVMDENTGEGYSFLASLPSELVNPDTLPTDPEEYYLVAALPESHVYLYAKNHGQDSLLLWNGNFWWPLTGRAAHTPRMNLPRLYLMDENTQATTVAAISEWASGTEVSVEQLVVYVMGEHQVDSSHYTGLKQAVYDWSSIHEAFNKKNTLVYDADTNSFTVFWNGMVYNSGELPQDMGYRFSLEDGYTGSLFANGDITKFTYVGGNRFTVTVKTAVEDRPLSIGETGLDLIWTVEFNGEGFDLVGEINLGSEIGVNQSPSATGSENGAAELPNGWKLNDFTIAGFDKDGLGDFGYRAVLSEDELESLPELLDLAEWQQLTNPPEYGLTVCLALTDSDAECFLYVLDGMDGKAVIKLSDPNTGESFVYLASEECITYAKALAAVLKDRAS